MIAKKLVVLSFWTPRVAQIRAQLKEAAVQTLWGFEVGQRKKEVCFVECHHLCFLLLKLDLS